MVLRIDTTGKFNVARRFERLAGMPNLNNEGFAIAPAAQCVNNLKPVFWADDTEDNGDAIRRGSLSCTAFEGAEGADLARSAAFTHAGIAGRRYTV